MEVPDLPVSHSMPKRFTNDVLPVLEDKKNHVIDALRYALEGVRTNRSMVITDRMLQEAARPMRY